MINSIYKKWPYGGNFYIILHHCICVQYCSKPPEKKGDITENAFMSYSYLEESISLLRGAWITFNLLGQSQIKDYAVLSNWLMVKKAFEACQLFREYSNLYELEISGHRL